VLTKKPSTCGLKATATYYVSVADGNDTFGRRLKSFRTPVAKRRHKMFDNHGSASAAPDAGLDRRPDRAGPRSSGAAFVYHRRLEGGVSLCQNTQLRLHRKSPTPRPIRQLGKFPGGFTFVVLHRGSRKECAEVEKRYRPTEDIG
jgi:hypothetical protein